MKSLALAVCGAACLSIASGAFAADRGENVLVVKPFNVKVPSALPSECAVEAMVRRVWSGSAFQVGQAVTLAVPCAGDSAEMQPARPNATVLRAFTIDPVVLRTGALGLAHVDDAGKLIWSPSDKSFGALGRISGYRVVEGKPPVVRRS